MSDLTVGAFGPGEILPERKVPKKDQLLVPLPIQLFGANAVETVGNTLFSEASVKTVSLIGYVAFSGVEKLGALVEGVVNVVINEEIAGSVTDLGVIATEERMKEGGENRETAADIVNWIPTLSTVSWIMNTSLGVNLSAALAHVSAAKSVFDMGTRIVFPVVRAAIKTPVRYLASAAGSAAEGFKERWETTPSSTAREALIETADLMRGKAWRAQHAAQRFFDKAAVYADQDRNTISTKKASRSGNQLTLDQYEKLSTSEKLRIVHLVKGHSLTSRERHELRIYQKVLEKGESTEGQKKIIQFLIKKFNSLLPSEQTAVLDISRNEVAKLSHEEQLALVGFLAQKAEKNDQVVAARDTARLKEIFQKLQSDEDCSVKDCQKVASCFKKYLSGQEKSAMRRLLHEQVVVSNGSVADIQKGINRLEEEIKTKGKEIEAKGTEPSQEDVLQISQLIEALAYLQEIQKTTEVEKALKNLPESREPGLAKQEYKEKIGTQVETKGKVSGAFDFVGGLGGAAVKKTGHTMSSALEAIGWFNNPAVVSTALTATAYWLENSQMLASITGWIPKFLGGEALSSMVVGLSDVTINSLIQAEAQAVGLFAAFSEFEKTAWGTFLNHLKDAAESRPLAEGLEAATKKANALRSAYQQTANPLMAHGDTIQKEMDAVGRQFETVINEFHKASPGDVIAFNYNHIVSTVHEQNPHLQKDAPEFFEKVFLGIQNGCTKFMSDIDKSIPREGFFWQTPTMTPPEQGLHDAFNMVRQSPVLEPMNALSSGMSPVVAENVMDATERLKYLAGVKEAAEDLEAKSKVAKDVLTNMEKSWSGWIASLSRASKEEISSIEKIHDNLKAGYDTAVSTVSTVQKGAAMNLETARAETNFFTGYGVVKKTMQWVAPTGFMAKSAMELAGSAGDYMSGRLATRILTRFTARTLRRATPYLAAYSQPFWYGFARGVTFAGEKGGDAVEVGVQMAGKVVQSAVNAAIKGGYQLAIGESYIDPARIDNYQNLTKQEQSHIRYLVFRSPSSVVIKEKLASHMGIKPERVESSLRGTQGKEDPRVVDLILQGFDQLDAEEVTLVSPASFLSMDREMRQRVVEIIQEHEELTVAEADNPVVIAEKFNSLLSEERKELSHITIDEFTQLPPDEQDDILYLTIHSKKYREEHYGHLPLREAMNEQIEDCWRIRKNGVSPKELKQLLALSSEISVEEKEQLTPEKLKSMGLPKARHLLETLTDLGKLYQLDSSKVKLLSSLKNKSNHPLVKRKQDEALVILTTLYNTTLKPFQKKFLCSLTSQEISQLDPQEKKGLVDYILKKDGLLSEADKKDLQAGGSEAILTHFNRLSIPDQSEWRQTVQISRKVGEEQRMDIQLEKEGAVRQLRKLKGELENVKQKFEDETEFYQKVDLGVEVRDHERQIKEVQELIKVCDKNLTQLKSGKPLTLESAPKTASEIKKEEEKQQLASTLFSEEVSAKGEDGMIEAIITAQLQPLFEKASSSDIKSYLDSCQARNDTLESGSLENKVLNKQIEILEQKLEVLTPEPVVEIPKMVTSDPIVSAAIPEEKGWFASFWSSVTSFFSSFFSQTPPPAPPKNEDEQK